MQTKDRETLKVLLAYHICTLICKQRPKYLYFVYSRSLHTHIYISNKILESLTLHSMLGMQSHMMCTRPMIREEWKCNEERPTWGRSISTSIWRECLQCMIFLRSTSAYRMVPIGLCGSWDSVHLVEELNRLFSAAKEETVEVMVQEPTHTGVNKNVNPRH